MTVSAVLFDVDGVLLDSTAAHRRIWNAWSQSRGLDAEKVWSLTHGRRPEDTVGLAAPHLDPAAERLVLDQLLHQELDAFPAVENAAWLLAGLPRNAWAIVTSGDRTSVHARFAVVGLPLPTVQIFGSDVTEAKPAPECYVLAAAALGVEPSMCLVVEDSPAGVAAGKAAGCQVAGLTTTHAAADLQPADLVFTSLAETADYLAKSGLFVDR
ncbi:HAD-IA family hydrolase [Streptomyces jeddahensis]|nr:HAD-IA family hydrolase [Streptomyces jeddahensis]